MTDTDLNPLDASEHHLSQKKPGAALKVLREAKSVSLAEISSKTLIPEWKLSDLEQDDYTRLGAEIFVIGYLRKVAKLLEVESDPLVAALEIDESTASETLHRATPTVTYAPVQPRRKGLLKRINSIPGPLAVAALLLLWGGSVWMLKMARSTSSSAPAPVAAQETAVAPEPDAAETAVIGDSGRPSAQEPPVPPTDSIMTDDSAEAPADIEATADVEPAPAAVQPAVPAAAQSAPAASEAPTGTRSESGTGSDQLSFSFTQDCWVKVTDATGEVVFAQLQRTGDNLQLFGEAPFRVMLGNARAADVMFNGKPVTINPVPGNDTLRFSVP